MSLAQVASKGSLAERPGSLAGLAAARRVHEGQFFTPTDLAAVVWRLVLPSMAPHAGQRLVHVIDTSIGSGRLLQFAEAGLHQVHGVDVDRACLQTVLEAARRGGVVGQLAPVGLEVCRPRGFDVAVLNPPFSLTLQSPYLEPGATTGYGPFGPDTSARSQWYALEQALRAASIVVAILPLTDVQALWADPRGRLGAAGRRLTMALQCPLGSFRSEGTDVTTGIVVFGPQAGARPTWHTLATLEDPLPECAFTLPKETTPRLGAQRFAVTAPVFTGPVTGVNEATLHHDGRRLVLTSPCAFALARARASISEHLLMPETRADWRRPKGVHAVGACRLDREVLLATGTWEAGLADLVARCAGVGVTLQVSATLQGHLRRRARASERQAAPHGRVAYDPDGLPAARHGVLNRPIVTDPRAWGSPALPKGTPVIATAEDGQYRLTPQVPSLPTLVVGEAQMLRDVTFTPGASPCDDEQRGGDSPSPDGSGCWYAVAAPMAERFPEAAAWWRARARATGVDQWLWDFQLEDAIEVLMKPQGSVVGWKTGLGKSRMAAALGMLVSGRRTAVVVPARLVEEMQQQWAKLPLPAGWYAVVRHVRDLQTTAPVLLIATEHLRMPVAPGARRTLATALRRRVSLLIADEADYLANPGSARTRALRQISARRRVLMTGTPIGNYPRDIMPLLTFACGDGTAAMPVGWFRPACHAAMWTHAQWAREGRDAIRADFTTLQWVTPEFSDTLRDGAKREIPVIKDLEKFRAVVGRGVKRRVHAEPAVRRHIQIPEPVWEAPTEVPWDSGHLAHFLTVADEFAHWYRAEREKAQHTGKSLSLVALLARIGAVERAGNAPGMRGDARGETRSETRWHYGEPTSKQRAVRDQVIHLAQAGHRMLVYARHPQSLDWLAAALTQAGVESVVLHGGRSIATRLRDLETRFRRGRVPAVLASYGTGERGYDLPEVDRILLQDRDWSANTETQALGRSLRPQQQKVVRVQPFHLPGSLDDYMAMLTDFKRDASNAGVDWGRPTMAPEDFTHLDTVVNRFVEHLAELRGVKAYALREDLKAAGRRRTGAAGIVGQQSVA